MDGIDFLGRLMRLRPMPVVMVSTLTERAVPTSRSGALELGAVDFVAKPKIRHCRRAAATGRRHHRQDPHCRARASVHRLAAPLAAPPRPARQRVRPATPPVSIGRLSTEKLIFIGASSTGQSHAQC